MTTLFFALGIETYPFDSQDDHRCAKVILPIKELSPMLDFWYI
jgi:hypothetical protein